MLTAERLRGLLDYDPETGSFTRATDAHGGRWKRGEGVGCVARRRTITYLRIYLEGRFHYAHRLAWLYVYGEWPSEVIDHSDGNGLNNRLGNLRLATYSENMWNSRKRVNNSSGKKGVYWSGKYEKWCADIWVHRKKHHLGYFDSLDEAANAYEAAAGRFHGQFARTQ